MGKYKGVSNFNILNTAVSDEGGLAALHKTYCLVRGAIFMWLKVLLYPSTCYLRRVRVLCSGREAYPAYANIYIKMVLTDGICSVI